MNRTGPGWPTASNLRLMAYQRRKPLPSTDKSDRLSKRGRQIVERLPPLSAKTAVALPFIKWPGGKRFLVRNLVACVPERFGRYYEPFLGSGALFFAIGPTSAVLSDSNAALIEAFVMIRDHAEEVISHLEKMPNSEADYYRIRQTAPRSPAKRAARLIYLVNLSFNGIFRVNFKGQFNVPYGHRTTRKAWSRDALVCASQMLANIELRTCDFSDATGGAVGGDLIYFDPPYTLAHSNNGFVRYNEKLFSWPDQIRLASTAQDLVQTGCHVILSNASAIDVRSLYPNFVPFIVPRRSYIAAHSEHRGRVNELVMVSPSIARFVEELAGA